MVVETASFENLTKMDELWVFGYGSLIWNPNFNYAEDFIGYIEDFSRKFWQGNTSHRGRPGNSRVWGRAFRVVGGNDVADCLDHLGVRECTMGGYDFQMKAFIPSSRRSQKCSREAISALVFVALPQNDQFLGPASVDDMADCILRSEGPAGRNLDYLLGIIEFLRYRVPREELIFEREIVDIERAIWFRLEREGWRTVEDCRGFFSFDGDNETVESMTDEQDFTPLLDTIRGFELERSAIERDVVGSKSILKLDDSSSPFDSDSAISGSLPSSIGDHVSDWMQRLSGDSEDAAYDSDCTSP